MAKKQAALTEMDGDSRLLPSPELPAVASASSRMLCTQAPAGPEGAWFRLLLIQSAWYSSLVNSHGPKTTAPRASPLSEQAPSRVSSFCSVLFQMMMS